MEYFSFDELVRLDASSAFRRRIEHRNVRVVRWFLWLAAISAFLECVPSIDHADYFRIVICAVNLLFVVALLRIFRRIAAVDRRSLKTRLSILDRSEAFVNRWKQPVILAFLAVEFLAGVAFISIDGPLGAWIITFAWALIAFRFLTADTLLLYGTIIVTTVALPLVAGLGAELKGLYWGGGAINATLALGISLLLTHRMRKSFVADWNREQDRARDENRIREEVAFAREVQLSMLPESVPEVQWLDIAATSLPATEVGGDYYDYFPIDANRLGIVSADVAGHGLASGLVLSGVRSSLHLLSNDLAEPHRVLARMNQMVRETSRHRMFVTLALLTIDQSRRVATIASAGHPPVLIRRADGGVAAIEIRSLPLGTRAPRDYEARDVGFGPGDIFVLHTDGVYETVDASGETYGMDRLSSALAGARTDNAESVIRCILDDLERFSGGRKFDDDVTIVVARVIE